MQHAPVGAAAARAPFQRGGDARHRLRAAEDEQQAVVRQDAERGARRRAVDVANERIGVPDTKLRPGKAARVGGNETATRVASRATAAVARPGITFPSQSRLGMPRARAAVTSGRAR